MFFSLLDSIVPASFNLFHCPVYVCVVSVLSCTVYVGVGVPFPQSVSVLVYCPVFVVWQHCTTLLGAGHSS